MSDHELMGIGPFSALCGVSISALRHYDEADLLRPAHVNELTNYRRYSPEQIETARMIRRLRTLDLPVTDIRTALRSDEAAVADLLEATTPDCKPTKNGYARRCTPQRDT